MKVEIRSQKNVRIGKTKDRGLTYFAKRNFKKGEIIMHISGPIVFKPTKYTIPIGEGMFIDPTPLGGMYLNDYVKPNLGIKNRTQIVAIENIKKNEEMGIGYFMIVPFYVKNSSAYKLKLSSFLNLSAKDKHKYKRYISDYLFNNKEIKKYKKYLA